MSEAGNQPDSEAPKAAVDTPTVPPWKQAWNTLADTVTKALQGPVEPSKPWERTWGGRQGLETPTTPSTPQFDTVFNKLVQAESGGVHKKDGKLLTSGAGAGGITQLMRKTAAKPGYGVTPVQDDSEKEYLRFGKDYLQALLKEFNGDYEKALAAYNYGPGALKKAIRKGADNWKAHVPDETRNYIKKIMKGL